MTDEFRISHRKENSPDTGHDEQGTEWDVRTREGAELNESHSADSNTGEKVYAYNDDQVDNPSSEFQLDIHRFISGVLQRKWLVLITASMVTAIVLAIIVFAIDRHWQASSTLIKRSHQDRLTLAERDPFKSQDYNLATLLDALKLPSSMEKVRDTLGLNTSITTLARAIEVALGRDSKIINLKVTWDDPEIAAKAANIVVDIFIERTRGLLRDDANTAYNYYYAQLEESRSKARQLSAKVLEFKQKNGISDLDAETKVILEEMSRLQGEYNTKLAETGALREAKKRLVDAIEKEPEQVITYTIYRSPLKNRLAGYEWELRDALSKYTSENPKVIKLKERIGVLKQMIEQSSDQAVPENTYAPNTKLEEMELRLHQITDDIKLYEVMAEALKDTINGMDNKLAVIASHDKEFMLLRAQLDGMLKLESQLAHRVEETRLAMQRNEASFDVVERATPPSDPQPSGRKLLAVVGLFLGIGSGLLLAILLELKDPYLRSKRDVTRISGDGICLEIPATNDHESELVDIDNPINRISNLYRSLINDIDASDSSASKVTGIVSVEAKAGRSLVAANLALARCIKGQNTLVVDADLRADIDFRVETLLGASNSTAGLYEYLVNGAALQINKLDSNKPDIITAGVSITDSEGLLALPRKDLLSLTGSSRTDRYRIYDLPPLQGLEPAFELAGQIGRVIVVTRSGHTRRDDLKQCIEQLDKRGIEVIASVILDVTADRLESAGVSLESSGAQGNSLKGVSVHA